jgi:hypothetical protein
MTKYTHEELRKYPDKEFWTPEEALATIEQADGIDCIHGVCLPFYVQTRADRVRWANCVRVAAQTFGDAVSSVLVQQTARVLFADRETYPDWRPSAIVSFCRGGRRSLSPRLRPTAEPEAA